MAGILSLSLLILTLRGTGFVISLVPRTSSFTVGRNVIISAAYNFKRNDLASFVNSFRSNFDESVDLVLLVGENDESYENSYSNVIFYRKSLREFDVQHLAHLRFLVYREFLLLSQNRYDMVLLTDSRDVVFQGNPFMNFHIVSQNTLVFNPNYNGIRGNLKSVVLDTNTVFFAMEGNEMNGLPISEDPSGFNPRWVKECAGNDIYEKVKHLPITCAGTTLGTMTSIQRYVDTLIIESSIGEEVKFLKCNDQGMHNLILHYLGPRNLLPFSTYQLFNGAGPIATVGHFPVLVNSSFSVSSNGFLQYSKPLASPSVIHQYDRLAEAEKFRSKFP